LMAVNDSSLADPQGEHDDWIELHNLTSDELDLSGMYLSDKEDNPRKWSFPDGTSIAANGFLIVWADEDGEDQPGLHANFKLSSSGETVLLVDRDDRENLLLDRVDFPPLGSDRSWGRIVDGSGEFGDLDPTPGQANAGDDPSASFVRGDVDADGGHSISDAVRILLYLFAAGAEPGCLDTADVDDTGAVNLGDATFLLAHLFQRGSPPAAPTSECGPDPSADGLSCSSFGGCGD